MTEIGATALAVMGIAGLAFLMVLGKMLQGNKAYYKSMDERQARYEYDILPK